MGLYARYLVPRLLALAMRNLEPLPHQRRIGSAATGVLRPDGQLPFVEHGCSPEPRISAWPDRLDPIWKRIADGCQLGRKINKLVTGNGFLIADLRTGHAAGPKPMTFKFRGQARPGRARDTGGSIPPLPRTIAGHRCGRHQFTPAGAGLEPTYSAA